MIGAHFLEYAGS